MSATLYVKSKIDQLLALRAARPAAALDGKPVRWDETAGAFADGTAAVQALGNGTYARADRSRRLFITGNSIVDTGNPGGMNGVGRMGGIGVFTGQSIIGQALLNLDGRVRYGGVAATGGYTSAQILATHLPTVLAQAKPGDICAVLAGGNDGTLGASKTSITAICAQLAAAGVRVILCTDPPSGDDALYQARNAWYQELALDQGYLIADFYGATVDPATGNYQTAYDSGDGIHPSAEGATACGRALAATIRDSVSASAPSVLPTTNSYPGALIGSNALFLTDAGADGVPDGWIGLADAGTSTSTLTDEDWAAGKVWTITRGDANALYRRGPDVTLVPGNRVQIAVRVKGTPGGGQWHLRLENTGSGGTLLGYTGISEDQDEPAVVVWDFIVPTLPSYTFAIDVYVQGMAGAKLELAQILARDLTAEGAAA